MIPSETRDLIFASAGILWGLVTVFRGIQEWTHKKNKAPFPAIIAIAAVMAVSCIGYLVRQL
jgi:uncharacterized membrane protein YsdA (DUF1294 family)